MFDTGSVWLDLFVIGAIIGAPGFFIASLMAGMLNIRGRDFDKTVGKYFGVLALLMIVSCTMGIATMDHGHRVLHNAE